MSDGKYNFLDNKVCDTISHLQSLSIEHSEKQPPYNVESSSSLTLKLCSKEEQQDKLKLNTHDNYSLRMQMTEQNKTIDSIRKEPQNKYERVLVGCKDTALFPGKIPGMMDSFFLACLRRVNPVRS